jgi:crotonobetainyl-CoA:carnitine CoA-transferase CaiB-like acyl-CoA transferase
VWGRLEQPGGFVRLSATPGPAELRPPAIVGEHTEEVLRELDFTDDEIAGFRVRGTVAG